MSGLCPECVPLPDEAMALLHAGWDEAGVGALCPRCGTPLELGWQGAECPACVRQNAETNGCRCMGTLRCLDPACVRCVSDLCHICVPDD